MEQYKKKLRIFNIGKINVVAVTAFFAALIFGFSVNLFAARTRLLATGSVAWDIVLSVALVAVGLAVHEGLHALAAIAFGKCKAGDIKFGFKPKEGLFYCHASKPMSGKAYLAVLVLPLAITLIPFAVCTALGGLMQIAAFALLIAGSAGDIVMAIGVIKEKDYERQVLDHGETTAYYALFDGDAELEELTKAEETELLLMPENRDGGKLAFKILLIALFIACTVAVMFVVGLFMEIV